MQMSKLIINIKELAQIRDVKTSFASASQMNEIPSLKNAFLLIENGLISDFGKMSNPNFNFVSHVSGCFFPAPPSPVGRLVFITATSRINQKRKELDNIRQNSP